MAPMNTDILFTFVDGRPITPEIALDVLDACHLAQESMSEISKQIANYLEAPWYQFAGAASRKRIATGNHDLFQELGLLNAKVHHLYKNQADARSSAKSKSVKSKTENFILPHWAEEVRKSAAKSRQFATWLQNKSESASAVELEKVYNEMLDVYELHRLNLQAVVGMMRDLLAAFESGERKVRNHDWMKGDPTFCRWLPDDSCEVKPLKKA